MGQTASLGWMAAILLVAALLRFSGLSERPMHADEAIQADRFGTLLASRHAPYEASDYHGTGLLYASLPAASIAGASSYRDLNETILRAVPAACGLALVLLSGWIGLLAGGRVAALSAAGFTAVSPGLVYFSRYYIPEQLLVLLTAAFLSGLLILVRDQAGSSRLLPWQKWAALAAAGVCAGLMIATKETAVLAFAAAGAGIVAAQCRISGWALLWMAGAAIVASALLLTPRGLGEASMSLVSHGQRAFAPGPHTQSWHYYFGILTRSGDIPFVLLAVGVIGVLKPRSPVTRFVGIYATVLTLIYCMLPYKTPWCAMSFLHGWILLAALLVPQWLKSRPDFRRPAALLAAFLGIVCVAQSWRLSTPLAADAANPYVYAHTLPGVYRIVREVCALTERGGDARTIPVQVFTTQNLWPLPWYFRHRQDVSWFRTVPGDVELAPVLLVTQEQEAHVAAQLYRQSPVGSGELPPAHLYLRLFAEPAWLRPGVEVRGYAALSLLDPP